MRIISISCVLMSLLFLITPEPERNATNAKLKEQIVEIIASEDAITTFRDEQETN